MFGQPKTRDEIGKETGKKGKELSQHLREITQNGGVIRRLVYVDPAVSGTRKAVYQTVPTNRSLEL